MITLEVCSRIYYGICHNQYFNCRGDASPHRELASPHRDLASPHWDLACPHRDSAFSIEVWALVEQTKKGLAPRINPTNSGRISSQVAVKTFFLLVFTWFREQKLFNFRWRPFFLFFIFGLHSISGKYFRIPNAIGLGCKSVAPCKILQFKYWSQRHS